MRGSAIIQLAEERSKIISRGGLLRATSLTILHPVRDREDALRGWCCGFHERTTRLGRLRRGVVSDQLAHLVAQETDAYYHERFHRIDYSWTRNRSPRPDLPFCLRSNESIASTAPSSTRNETLQSASIDAFPLPRVTFERSGIKHRAEY